MNEEHIKILKTMSEAINRMDLNMFAKSVNLSPNQTIAEIRELAEEGFLRKIGSGFGLTEKGKNILKILKHVQYESAFHFYIDINKPIGSSAQSLKEFHWQIKQVTADSLKFHLYRGDFENWLCEVLNYSELAEDFDFVKAKKLEGEELREALLETIDAKYGTIE